MGLIRMFKDRLLKNKEPEPCCAAVVVAAGNSSRMGENKMFMPIADIPLLALTLINLSACADIGEIVIAARGEDIIAVGDIVKDYSITKVTHIVAGGETRADSVLAGINEVSAKTRLIAIHDGARPFITAALCTEAITKALLCGAAAPAVPVKDTIKVCVNGIIESTPDREKLFHIQTPQVFEADLIRTALLAAKEAGLSLTDDCAAVERTGIHVAITQGSYENIKITTREDIAAAEAIMEGSDDQNRTRVRRA